MIAYARNGGPAGVEEMGAEEIDTAGSLMGVFVYGTAPVIFTR